MKTAGTMPRADKQKAENVFQPGKLPFSVFIYIVNDPVFQRRSNIRFQILALEGNQICVHLSRQINVYHIRRHKATSFRILKCKCFHIINIWSRTIICMGNIPF